MKIAFLFPGQGAQKQNMGKSFYENDANSRAVFDSVKTVTGIDACDLIFKENDELNNTRFTQIAMVATGIAMLKAIEKTGLKADICAGLSLGEYEALYLSGAINETDAIAIVDKRGRYMSEIKGGAMSAVLSLSNETIKAIVDDIEGCWVANYNCPGQTVISGTVEAVALAGEKLKEAGAKRVLPLKVSGAFHSGLMKEAGDKLGKALDDIEIKDIRIPYVANINAEIVTDKNDIRKNLIEQVSGSVHLEQSIRKMIEWGVDTFVEIGPGKTMAGFVKKIDADVKIFNIEEYEDIEKVCSQILEAK